MEENYIENIGEVLKNKSKIEKELKVKIKNQGKIVFIRGEGDKTYIANKVLEAIDLGFSINRAILLKDEEIIFQIINIRDFTKKTNLDSIKARIIGIHGKTIKTLSSLSDCAISLNGNQIGIIGHVEDIKEATQAIQLIIQGSKQSNVYARLEREKKKKRLIGKTNIKDENKNHINDSDEESF
jgi:KH domain-containing protein